MKARLADFPRELYVTSAFLSLTHFNTTFSVCISLLDMGLHLSTTLTFCPLDSVLLWSILQQEIDSHGQTPSPKWWLSGTRSKIFAIDDWG
jgi:hypothetical protein